MSAKRSKHEIQYATDIELLKQYDFYCGYCGFDFLKDPYAFKDIEFDHILPRKHGGKEENNRIPACHFCNSIKSSKKFKNLEEAREKLKQLREEYLARWKYSEFQKQYRKNLSD